MALSGLLEWSGGGETAADSLGAEGDQVVVEVLEKRGKDAEGMAGLHAAFGETHAGGDPVWAAIATDGDSAIAGN